MSRAKVCGGITGFPAAISTFRTQKEKAGARTNRLLPCFLVLVTLFNRRKLVAKALHVLLPRFQKLGLLLCCGQRDEGWRRYIAGETREGLNHQNILKKKR